MKPTPDTEQLLARAASDPAARSELLARHRARLERMVGFHLDRRLAARVDPSDVVQDALVVANARLSDYLRTRPLPFYPWLRQFAADRLVELRRTHLEGLSTTDAAAVLGISEGAFKSRHLRALQRLRGLLGEGFSEESP